MKLWLVFVVGAILAWGCYVPMLHEGQKVLGGKPSPGAGAMRAFLCVGVAYFIVAVLIPGFLLMTTNIEETSFNGRGTTFATIAGGLGAIGALCIIFSLGSGGTPTVVPPLVFAGAPIINVLVTIAWHRPANPPSVVFYLGLVMAALGVGLVLAFKPT